MTSGEQRGVWTAVALITIAGLILRILAARGGLWLDEAWSAVTAQDVGTPAGVFVGINHDNNHHLNSLWLQWVGSGAPPLLQRALSIITGSATIALAAAIALRRGRASAILAAVAFAVSPFLVTFGSEARGYAPMLLAWVAAIGVADRWLADPAARPPTTAIALAAIFGCLSQATMFFALAALGPWVAIGRWRAAGWRCAVRDTARLFIPAAIAVMLLIAIAWTAAATSRTGFQFGAREPHDDWKMLTGLEQLWTWSCGLWVIAPVIAIAGWFVRDRFTGLVLLTAIALPLTVALLALPNSGASRYYIVAVPPLLLSAASTLPVLWARRGVWRLPVLIAGALFVWTAIERDGALVANLRGDPGQAVSKLIEVGPGGARVSVALSRSTAILIAAARSRGYRLTIDDSRCAPFRFIERDGGNRFPDPLVHCGRQFEEIARGDPNGVSGSHWRLYARSR
ncbi:hypothetical protein ASE90_15630 [Sphingomonas sp. Leaf67]|uniref:hypothetical protein n=1 Tax=Sphingomonas sp. Leaf67 TaxID=1736230 RepID=UPI0006F2CE5D|nr:hypothetical protein [Sphingomonas sp. Leaf67]KQN80338.1 hypothetical protein ASE90_15630 [Sphingomonas sp. Leaf67]